MKYRLLKELYDCSFISGFTLAWKLSAELNNCENERLFQLKALIVQCMQLLATA